MSRAVVIFARLPELEAAAKRLPVQTATPLFRAVTASWLRAAAASGATPLVACTRDARVRFDTIAPEIGRLYIDQRGASFGERLASAADAAFALRFSEVLVTGIDAPLLPDVSAVFDELANARAVVGAARDGGINFIALRAPERELLSSIAARQRDVLARCRAYFETLVVMPASPDIDTVADLAEPLVYSSIALPVIPARPLRRHTTRPPPA